MLIEPFQPNYMELVRNRSSTNFFKNAACVGPTYTNSSIQLAYSNLMTSTLEISSTIPNPKDYAANGAKLFGEKFALFEAPACTLNSILIEANAPFLINLLCLDVEGTELEVLKGLDHTKYRFGYICVESTQFGEISNYLSSHNYSYIGALSKHDHLFKNSQ